MFSPLKELSCLWCATVCDWFSNLLLGKTIEISISECKSSNLVLLEVFLPLNEVNKSIFPSILLSDVNNDSVCLSSLVDSIGLSLINYCIDSNEVFKRDVLHVAHLPPLIIKLNSSFEFTCLMSHVADEAHFYVHPIQEDLAHNINYINDELYNHYNIEENCIPLSTEEMNCGILCSVYSVVFQQWCRGVITRIESELKWSA